MSYRNEWRDFSRSQPCPICGRTRWCGQSLETGWIQCKTGGAPGGIERNGSFYYPPAGERWEPRVVTRTSALLADDETRDRVYRALLARLPLSARHHHHLITERRFSAELIRRNGYRTLPVPGRAAFARELAQAFGADVCSTVPGWVVRPGEHGEYATLAGPAGLLIPVRSAEGHVVTLRVRVDDAEHGGKYRYLTSCTQQDPGPQAEPRIHVPQYGGNPTLVRVTEGEFKAEIATLLSGTLTISLPGVTSQWELVPVLHALGARYCLLAFDADFRQNRHVLAALGRALETVRNAGIKCGVEAWDPRWKGVDELYQAHGEPEVRWDRAATAWLAGFQPVGRRV